MRSLVFVFTCLFALSACTDGFVSFPVTEDAQKSLGDDVEIIRLNASNIGSFTSPAPGYATSEMSGGSGWDYRVGVGDILNVIVFDHPELTSPAGPERSAEESGFRVQSDGTFFYPFIGQVQARGRVPEEIRADVTQRLSEFGIHSSGEVDRFYFRSLYFREPNGILFEIATDGPGFASDEPMSTLGEKLALPPFLEGRRREIEAGLKPLT